MSLLGPEGHTVSAAAVQLHSCGRRRSINKQAWRGSAGTSLWALKSNCKFSGSVIWGWGRGKGRFTVVCMKNNTMINQKYKNKLFHVPTTANLLLPTLRYSYKHFITSLLHVKSILSSRAAQRQAAGHLWPVGCKFLTFGSQQAAGKLVFKQVKR